MTTTTPTAQAAAATNARTNATSSTAQAAGANATQQLADNFNTFLTLLTTQLKNQNPLDPLDTNQFTQQLVEFASVEQQVNMNTNIKTLISLQQTNEATRALQFLGTKVIVSRKTAALSNANGAPAAWTVSSPSPATANVTISTSNGQTAFSGPLSLSAGNQTFTWNGKGNNGITRPDGQYTITINAKGANGQPVAVSTQVQGVVSGIDLCQNPPQLTIGGQDYAINQIQSICR